MDAITVFIEANHQSLLWLLVAALMIVVEAVTVQLVSVWFAIGAVAAVFAALLDGAVSVQFLVFFVVSAAALLLTRPFVSKVLRVKKTATNADSVIGLCGSVTQEIDNLAGTGKVYVNGLTWTARAKNGETFPVGATVVVDRIEGVKLIVEANLAAAPDQ